MVLGLLAAIGAMGQSKNDDKAIEEVIAKFARAADAQDVPALDGLLDAHYRIVMNQLFGSPDVVVMDRATYLAKIKSKEFGGEKRKVEIQQIVLNGNTAIAKVSFKGQKMTFVSLLQFVRTKDGAWKVVNDMPVVI